MTTSVDPKVRRAIRLLLAACLALAARPLAVRAVDADLSVTLTNSETIVSVGQHYTFSASVWNSGPGAGEAVLLTCQLPAEAAYVSAVSSQGIVTQYSGVVSCAFGGLAPGSRATLLVEMRASRAGSLTNRAAVSSQSFDPVAANNSTSTEVMATTAQFAGVGPMQVARYSHTSTWLTNGEVLIAGGWNSNRTERYRPESRSFLPAADMTTPRRKHSATRLLDGRVFIAGGSAATAEFYDPATDSFRLATGPLAMMRWDHSAALLPDGKVLLNGGGTAAAQSELFDPATETSSFTGTRSFVFHYSSSAALKDGRVLVIAGYGPGSTAVYDSTFSDFTGMAEVPWWRGTATTLPNGQVLVIGHDYNLGPAADLYDPATGKFTSTGPPLESRVYHTATLLPGGQVLVVGGFAYDGWNAPVRSSVELYDWTTGQFTRTARLNTGRAYHTATLLPDGTVLVAGGINNIDGQLPVFDTAEIYYPNGSQIEPSLTLLDATVAEGNAGSNWLTFTLQLSASSTNTVSAGWRTKDGTAHSWWEFGGFDFVPMSGKVEIPPGATQGSFGIPVLGDNIHEPDETVIVQLDQPTHAWIARATASGTLLNDDALLSISVDSVTKVEGDTGVSEFVFQVDLSAPSLDVVMVDYQTGDQTALAGEDYQRAAGTLAFPSQTTSLSVTIPVIGELAAEAEESFTLNLTNPRNGSIAAGTGVGTIVNDDGFSNRVHHLEFGPISVTNMQSRAFPVAVVARDFAGNIVTDFTGPIVLSALATNVNAANLDFQSPSLAPWTPISGVSVPGPYSQANFDCSGNGQLSTAFRINAGDGWDGITQDVWLTGGLTYRASVNFGFSLGHNDCSWGQGLAHLQLGGQDAVLGMPTLCHGEQGRAPVSLDFTAPTNGYYPLNLVFDRSESSDPPYYGFADDVRISPLVFGPMILANFTNGIWNGLVTITQAFDQLTFLADDGLGHRGTSEPFDVVPSANLVLTGVAEEQGASPLRTGMDLLFNLSLTNQGPSAASNVVIQYALPAGMSFIAGTNSQGTISNLGGVVQCLIAALPPFMAARASLVVRTVLPGEIVSEFLASASTAELDEVDNLMSLTNVVKPPLLTVTDASGIEAIAATNGIAFNVVLSGASGQTISVGYHTVDATAVSGTDFIGASGTLTLPAGTAGASVLVFLIDDFLNEPTHSFSLVLNDAVNAEIAGGLAIGTVVDDDLPPVLGIGDTSVREGDSGSANAVFSVFLSKPAISNVVVTCSTLPGTASAGSDYVSFTDTLTFLPFATNQTVTVQVRGNTVSEPDETFYVALNSPVNATLSPDAAKAACVILNDDAVPGRLDHFVFDPVSSPQYTNIAFLFTMRAVDFAGTVVESFNGEVGLSAQTDDWVTERVTDDFEDADLAGWTNYPGSSMLVSNVSDLAATGARSVRLTGKALQSGSTFGLRRGFAGRMPNRIAFDARVAQTNALAGRLVIVTGRTTPVDFYFDAKGSMRLVSGNHSAFFPYQADYWYHVELDLDEVTRTITARIDGIEVTTSLPFLVDANSTSGYVSLLNVGNAAAWFDNIRLFDLNHTNLMLSPTNLAAFTNGLWSGSAAVFPAAKKVYLAAQDSTEHTGRSSVFNVEPWMRFGKVELSDSGQVQLSVFGVPGELYALEASTNLADWVPILNFLCAGQPTLVTDPAGQIFSQRFYRIVTVARPPPQ